MTVTLPLDLDMAGTVVRKDAILSEDGLYRYGLTRAWHRAPALVTFVMLNPSTADAAEDDPTIGRCIGFARTWGFGGISVVNLYALRSTDPKGLWAAADPVGPENDRHLSVAAALASTSEAPVVAAWGANARPDRVSHVAALFKRLGTPLHALGTTKAGQPRHPLYLRADSPLTPWENPHD